MADTAHDLLRDTAIGTRRVADFLADPPDLPAGDLIGHARQLRAASIQTMFASVLHARETGMSWADIAPRLGMTAQDAEGVYGEAETRWKAGDPTPWASAPVGPVAPR